MYIKLKQGCAEWLLILLLLVFTCDASAATRAQCRNNMVVNEVQSLNFGDYDGTIAGTITVGTNDSWSANGPILLGGTVQAGHYEVSSGILGCESYPVAITYIGNPRLTGTGTNMPINTFTSAPASLFTISPLANVPTAVNIGGNLDSGAAQGAGAYTGVYRVKFTFQ